MGAFGLFRMDQVVCGLLNLLGIGWRSEADLLFPDLAQVPF